MRVVDIVVAWNHEYAYSGVTHRRKAAVAKVQMRNGLPVLREVAGNQQHFRRLVEDARRRFPDKPGAFAQELSVIGDICLQSFAVLFEQGGSHEVHVGYHRHLEGFCRRWNGKARQQHQ